MKRNIALFLSLIMVAVLFASCTGSELPLSTRPTQSSISDSITDHKGNENDSKETEPAKTEIVESVIFDSNNVTVTVKGIDSDAFFGPEIKLLVENKTDKNIVLSGDTFVVNGIAVSGMLYIEVAAGKKANDTLSLTQNELDEAGIEDIVTIVSCDAHVYDSDSYEDICDVSFNISTSSTYQQTIDDSGDVVFEENGIKVIAKTISDDWLGKSVKLFVVNNSGSDIYAQAENISVNGFTVTAWMSDLVPNGTVRYCDLGIFESDLEENEITEIEDITFTFVAVHADSFNQIAQSDEIQILVS